MCTVGLGTIKKKPERVYNALSGFNLLTSQLNIHRVGYESGDGVTE